MSTDQPSPGVYEDLEQFPTVIERKHKVKRFRRRYGATEFFVCEIWKPGAPKHSASILHRTDSGTLDGATREATRIVGVMVRNGGKVPPSEIGADVTFDTGADAGLSGLNPKSLSGKPQWCEQHWAALEEAALAKTHNAIVAGMLLTSVFIEEIKRQGVVNVPAKIDGYAMELLRDSYSPFCCWLGQSAVDQIMAASTVEEIERSGILRQLEQQLKNRQK